MNGQDMLLNAAVKALGLDPVEVKQKIEELKVGLPAFARGLQQKVENLETKLSDIQRTQTQILTSLQELKGGIGPESPSAPEPEIQLLNGGAHGPVS